MRQNGCGNDGLWTPRKTKGRFSTGVHSPWKSQTTRFPHFHSGGEARESGKPKAGFPLSRLLFFLPPKRIRKEAWRRIASLPAFRLILGLENAARKQTMSERSNLNRVTGCVCSSMNTMHHDGHRIDAALA